MQLQFGIVQSCSPQGCEVLLLNSGQVISAHYSTLVRDQIRIRPRQLVAVDLQPDVPEIVYRWYRARVVEKTGDGYILESLGVRVEMGPPAELLGGVQIQPGQEVWIAGTPAGKVIHDVVVDDRPGNPERLAAHFFPLIEEMYLEAGA